MKKGAFVPDRGNIILLNFSPQTAHEQAGKRPALVLSAKSYNDVSGLAFCCPITRTRRKHPFEILLPPDMKTTGSVLVEQLKSLAWQARDAQFIESAPAFIVDEAIAKIFAILSH